MNYLCFKLLAWAVQTLNYKIGPSSCLFYYSTTRTLMRPPNVQYLSVFSCSGVVFKQTDVIRCTKLSTIHNKHACCASGGSKNRCKVIIVHCPSSVYLRKNIPWKWVWRQMVAVFSATRVSFFLHYYKTHCGTSKPSTWSNTSSSGNMLIAVFFTMKFVVSGCVYFFVVVVEGVG